MSRIDLNCDMGESFGAWSMGHDAEVMGSITSANVACGFHGATLKSCGAPYASRGSMASLWARTRGCPIWSDSAGAR